MEEYKTDYRPGYLDFELRNYDLATSKWMQTDPMKQYWSPYTGMGNNPVSKVDPTGGCDY
jgi:RHS repeat-associated protein